ncbi:MAG: hypothetical protein ACRENP_29690, partial [Longimicrobiales bacterium]
DSLSIAAATARTQINTHVTWLERHVLPKATGDFAIGAENLARRYRAEELVDTPLPQLVALGERELAAAQRAFRSAAQRLAPGRHPMETWRTVRRDVWQRRPAVSAGPAE